MGKIFLYFERLIPTLWGIVVFFPLILVSVPISADAVTTNIDVIRVADYTHFTRIALELSNDSFFCTVNPLTEEPPILLVTLTSTKASKFGNEYKPETEAFGKIAFSANSKKGLELTIPLSENVDIHGIVFNVWSSLVTIDLPLKKPNNKYIPSIEDIQEKKIKEGKKVIVIDAGHGGLDPGTSGGYYIPVQQRMKEKDVALDVAKRLQAYLAKDPKYLPLLTRHGDYLPAPFGAKGTSRGQYVKEALYYRVQLAKEYCGDIFISIHLNSIGGRAKQKTVRGFEIFYLGDNFAEKMIDNDENPDIAALAALDNLREEDTFIISSLVKDRILSDSKQLASSILDKMRNVPGVTLGSRPMRPNRLIVTKQFQMPSVLVELAYLSHKTDHANVRKTETRNKMAYALYQAVDTFFYKPTDIPMIAKSKSPSAVKANTTTSTNRKSSIPATHTVKRGDTITGIADRYGISVRQLTSANGRKIGRNFKIIEGQKLILPSSASSTSRQNVAASSSSSSKLISYTVKKGDSLEEIANRYGSSVSEIKSLNRKKSNVIHPGEKLKVRTGRKVATARSIRYTVRRGDTLGKIADRFKVSLSRLKSHNRLRTSRINAGKVLMIP